LPGNSLFALSVSTGAADLLGLNPGSSTTLRFTTLMDRSVRNVVSDGAGGAVIDVPAGDLPADGYISLDASPAVASQATQKLLEDTGDALRAPLSGSLVALTARDAAGGAQAFSQPVEVSLPYADADDDGVVDGTSPPVRAKSLAVHWLDETHGLWVRLPSSVDPAAKTVTARAAHFTTFAAIGQADADLSQARAFPVPWRPSTGPLTFTSVGQSGSIRIYTPNGALVREIPVGPSGQETWDGTNEGGNKVVSGVYLFRVQGAGAEKRGKLVVIR
jgi:hypothetical protein